MGPSGAGKDSVIDGAREQLARIPVHVARRIITRSAESVGEQAIGVSAQRFSVMQQSGDFAMNWRANGHDYGISVDINRRLADGGHVLVNGSRDYLPEAQRRYPDLLPIVLIVERSVLRQRLQRRARENEEEIAQRLQRNDHLDMALVGPQAAPGALEYLDNSGTLSSAVERLMAILRAHGLSAAGDRT
jgi:ribose 1,5-bisphosphokinase